MMQNDTKWNTKTKESKAGLFSGNQAIDRTSTRVRGSHECEGTNIASRGRFFRGDDGAAYPGR